MKLDAWINQEIAEGRAKGRKDAYQKLSEATKSAAAKDGGDTVSALTVEDAAGGKRIKKYDKAKAIEKATGGKVTIAELCE